MPLSKESIDGLTARLHLNQLYLIAFDEYETPPKIVMGARGENLNAEAIDVLKRKIAEVAGLDAAADVAVLTEARDEVEYLLNERIRPAVMLHGGTIDIFEIREKEGLVILSMKDACSGCPHSMATLKLGIEKVLREHLPWFNAVESAEDPTEPDFGIFIENEGGNENGRKN